MLVRAKRVVALTLAVLLLAVLLLSACGVTPGSHTPATLIARIEVQPSALLLTHPGETYPFSARAFDQEGNPLAVDFTWHSSRSDHVAVNQVGVVMSGRGVGSAQIYVEAEGVRSAPSQVVVAELHEGTILIDDDQVVGGPTAVDPDAAYYEVTLRRTPVPAPGALMVARESAAIAGRVISSSGAEAEPTVLLELVPLDDLFVQHDLAFAFDLSLYDLEPIEIKPDVQGRSASSLNHQSEAKLDKKKDFGLGPLECSAAASAYIKPTVFDVSLASTPVLHYVDSKAAGQDRYVKLHLVGDMALTVSGGVKVEAGFTGEASCELVKRKVIPLGGFVSLFIAPAIPMGIGFGIDGTFILADGEAVVTGKVGASMDLGFECGPDGRPCRSIDVLEPIMELKPEWKIPGGVNDMRIEVGAGFHLLTGLDTQFLRSINKSVFRLTAGPRGDLDLRTVTRQTDDASYASFYDLKLRLEAKVGDDLQGLIDTLLKGAQASFEFKAHVDKPLFRSPFGSLRVSASQVDIDKVVNFTVALDPTSATNPVLGYMVNDVRIYHVKEGRPELLHSIPVTASGQTTFDYAWTATRPFVGPNEFVAFAVSKWLPFIPLEVHEDSTVRVEVLERCAPEGQASAALTNRGVVVQADPCACEAFQTVESWNGQANFSYSYLFDNGAARETQSLSATLTGTLVHEFHEDTYSATAVGSPTGTASLDDRVYYYHPAWGLTLLISKVGTKAPNPYDPPTGSRLYINFDLVNCRYNVYGLAEINVEVTDHPNNRSHQEDITVAAFGTGWMPLPTGSMSLSDGGTYPLETIYSERLDKWIAPYNVDRHAVRAGGVENLNAATVSWSFTPVLPSTSP